MFPYAKGQHRYRLALTSMTSGCGPHLCLLKLVEASPFVDLITTLLVDEAGIGVNETYRG
jgi:hypothetical protein